ncbi:MAG: hypothetical protein IKM18_05115, partial [Clostridia bacterium]|nr:hypothetical protein [Clostridia bacterium]
TTAATAATTTRAPIILSATQRTLFSLFIFNSFSPTPYHFIETADMLSVILPLGIPENSGCD